jgi:hypothetical protein
MAVLMDDAVLRHIDDLDKLGSSKLSSRARERRSKTARAA